MAAPYTPKAQEGRNKVVVQRYFHEVLDGKRIELMPELFSRNVVLHRPGFDVTGLEAAMQRLRTVLQDYTAFSTELTGLIAESDMVSARLVHRARMRPHTFHSRAGNLSISDERDLTWSALVQFRLADGRIAEEWVMRDELGMLLQLGQVTVVP
jgi:predicted ester cyclase